MYPTLQTFFDENSVNDFYRILQTSYENPHGANNYLSNHHSSWKVVKQKDLSYYLYGSWKLHILHNQTTNKWMFTVEGTSSIKNVIGDVVMQILKGCKIIDEVEERCHKYAKKHNIQFDYAVGHSAAGLICSQVIKHHHFSNTVCITYNTQRPQSSAVPAAEKA